MALRTSAEKAERLSSCASRAAVPLCSRRQKLLPPRTLRFTKEFFVFLRDLGGGNVLLAGGYGLRQTLVIPCAAPASERSRPLAGQAGNWLSERRPRLSEVRRRT